MISPDVEPEAHNETTRAKQAVELIKSLRVVTQEHILAASPLLQQIKGDMKRLDERKKAITKPLNDALRSVRDLFRPAEQALEEAERHLKTEIGNAQRNIQEANRLAALATQAALQQHDVRAAALASGAIQATEAPQGISYRDRFEFRIVDAAKLPREFLMPDERRIRAYIAEHGERASIPGVAIEKRVAVVARASG
jgi:hypothetical protein